jgi:GntR family transcriptional regulator / MocR family aminotransferase
MMSTPVQEVRLAGSLDPGSGVPLHQQVAEAIRQRIDSGALGEGARLPSSRDLAVQLGVSRATVELAYGNLAADGYLARRPAAGTTVLRAHPGMPRGQPRASPVLLPGMASQPGRMPQLFQMGLPALDEFPRKLWSRLAARHARSLSPAKMVYQDPAGYGPLRRAIANHLAIGRGLPCSEAQVFVTSGYLGALALAARALLGPGDKVLVEDPGFPPAREAILLAGGVPTAVPVDAAGMDFAAGIDAAPDARAALVTPTVQFPLGIPLSESRWAQMLEWACRSGAWILRDDYEDSLGRTPGTVALSNGPGAADRVVHLGSFSNVLFPGLRAGYLVVPRALAPRLEYAAALVPTHPSIVDQMVLCDFIEQGHFARHLARTRRLCAARKRALAQALSRVLGPGIHVDDHCGMHLLLRLPPQCDDVSLASMARSQGLAVNALSAMSLRAATGPGLLLGYANVRPDAARDAASCLARALHAVFPGAGQGDQRTHRC